ncbi:MAG: translation elongation factor 4 [Candidatus Omnitrophota bacterium]|nr:translation elongation factor 4 [Candidatus Omnitrophota bacterium]
MDKSLIRNFSIIAHIDHGKSTLADRILEISGAVDKRHFHNQILDDMELERERGITIKASAVRINYKAKDGNNYILNLIDTPGHIDFSYEVTKSLAACEGALLLVDASQGIEAQTVANYYLAIENNLEIIPVINKIDIAGVDIERVKKQLRDILKFKEEDMILASAKEGIGIDEILERVTKVIPEPSGDSNQPLQALIFDSSFDIYKGVVVYVRVVNGKISYGQPIKMMHSGKEFIIEEVGVFKPQSEKIDCLSCGEVGYITCNLRQPQEIIIGDTITDVKNSAKLPLPSYKKIKPMVFCGIYPVNSKDFLSLRQAIEKLSLNDASFVYGLETSQSFGHGFRCGFLGLLHMEIVQERLEREYALNLLLTTPNVVYRIETKDGKVQEVVNPSDLPAVQDISSVEEPYITASILIPIEFIEGVIDFAKKRQGIYQKTEYLGERIRLIFDIPLSEVIVDFYDNIKSLTKGYGSLDYEFKGYYPVKITKLDIIINSKVCDAFSSLISKEKAQVKARALVEKLKELIPRQLFEVVIQASADGKIIASEKVRAMGKHVTAKCYGGDITRKRKLWEKQKEGKKRLKRFGNVEIPQEAFLAVLKI